MPHKPYWESSLAPLKECLLRFMRFLYKNQNAAARNYQAFPERPLEFRGDVPRRRIPFTRLGVNEFTGKTGNK